MDRQMPVEMKRRLCDGLLRIDAVGERDTRNLYVSELEAQLGQSPNVRHYPDARHDVWSLINSCLARPGSLRAFVQIAKGFHGESADIIELENLVDEIERVSLLTPSEREALVRLVAQVPAHRLVAAYQGLAESPTEDSAPNWTDARAVVRRVEFATGSDSSFGAATTGPPSCTRSSSHRPSCTIGKR